jgi:hypothetical protein
LLLLPYSHRQENYSLFQKIVSFIFCLDNTPPPHTPNLTIPELYNKSVESYTEAPKYYTTTHAAPDLYTVAPKYCITKAPVSTQLRMLRQLTTPRPPSTSLLLSLLFYRLHFVDMSSLGTGVEVMLDVSFNY